MSPRRLLTGDALLKRARELGVNTHGDPRLEPTISLPVPSPAAEYEIQDRVLEAERHLRERRWFTVAVTTSLVGAIVAVGSLFAVVRSGQLQTQGQRDLLGAQLGLEMIKLFDSLEMRRARRQFAVELLSGKQVNEERVLDFFDTLALYRHKGRIDEVTVYSSFSHWIERYWAAAREHVAELRKEDNDDRLYADFEKLNDAMLALDATKQEKPASTIVPSAATVERFLREEANLPK